jgi:hypothetical protein
VQAQQQQQPGASVPAAGSASQQSVQGIGNNRPQAAVAANLTDPSSVR